MSYGCLCLSLPKIFGVFSSIVAVIEIVSSDLWDIAEIKVTSALDTCKKG